MASFSTSCKVCIKHGSDIKFAWVILAAMLAAYSLTTRWTLLLLSLNFCIVFNMFSLVLTAECLSLNGVTCKMAHLNS